MTKTEPKLTLLFLLPVYAIVILAGIILLSLQKWAWAIITLFPLSFLYFIWMTFIWSRDYKGTKKSVHFGYLFLRYLLVILAIIIPSIFYGYIPWFSSNLNGFSLLISPSEVLILYGLIIFETLRKEKQEEKD